MRATSVFAILLVYIAVSVGTAMAEQPNVTYVSSTTDDATYGADDSITITVTFSQNVLVSATGGIPSIQLETGTIDRYANYSDGSGTNTLTFNYVVQPGDTSSRLNYVDTNSLVLNDGQIGIKNIDAILTLPSLNGPNSLSANKYIVINTNGPPSPAPELPSLLLTSAGLIEVILLTRKYKR